MELYETTSSYDHIGMEGEERNVVLEVIDKNKGLGENLSDWPVCFAM